MHRNVVEADKIGFCSSRCCCSRRRFEYVDRNFFSPVARCTCRSAMCDREGFLTRTKTLVKHHARRFTSPRFASSRLAPPPPPLLRDASTYKYPRLEGTLHRLENDTRVVQGIRSSTNFERCSQRATHAVALEARKRDHETMTVTSGGS